MPNIADSTAETKQEIRDVCAISTFAAFAANSSTPAVGTSGTFKTANTAPISINNFLGGYDGQRINVVINDVFTTLDFTTSNLIGNGGVDWVTSLGDSFTAVYDGTYWFCIITVTSVPSLTTPRAINGIDFDGTTAINIPIYTSIVDRAATVFPVLVGGNGIGNQNAEVMSSIYFNNITSIFTVPAISVSTAGLIINGTAVTTTAAELNGLPAHIADSTIHFLQSEISITESQINDLGTYEDYLGIPSENGYVLTSTIAGVRSWVLNSPDNWTNANNGLDFTTAPIAVGLNAIAMGDNATAPEDYTLALGSLANAAGYGNISIGINAVSLGDTVGLEVINNTAIGSDSLASGDSGATAIGNNSTASGINSIALGGYSVAQGENSVAIGETLTANALEVRIGSTNNQLYLNASGYLSLVGTSAMYKLPTYTVLTVPTVSVSGLIYVSNGAGGAPVMAFSDGTNWLRCDTLAAIS